MSRRARYLVTYSSAWSSFGAIRAIRLAADGTIVESGADGGIVISSAERGIAGHLVSTPDGAEFS